MDTSTLAGSTSRTRQKTGLVIAGLLSATSIPSVLMPTPDGEEGPPIVVLVLSSILGLVGLAAVVAAWRRDNRPMLRLAAGCLAVNAITALPAFFVDVPAALKIASGVSVLLTIAAVVLMFSPIRRPVPVLDAGGPR